MRRIFRLGAPVAAATLAACLVVLQHPAAASTTPPWEPDPNALGTLSFYDASGTVVTGGTDLTHIAEYAVASTAGTSGATLATLFFALPKESTATGAWTAAAGSASTAYPNSAAPSPVKDTSDPVVTLDSSNDDGDLASFVATHPHQNTESSSYQGMYQVRVKDSGPGGVTSGSNYWESDVLVTFDGGGNPTSWAQVFPAVIQSTTTTLEASPVATQVHNQSVTFTATVSPPAAGTVQFKDSGANVGSAQSVNTSTGEAALTTSALSIGDHSITAEFTPTDASAFSGSTSSALPYSITAAPPTWKPVLFGPHRVGLADQCLAAFNGDSVTVTYQWFQNGVQIAGAASSSYVIAEAYYTRSLSCAVTATNSVGNESAVSSTAHIGVGPALRVVGKPYLYRGTNRASAATGQYEYVNHGSWTPAATRYGYQWYIGTSRIRGATGTRFKIPAGHKGQYVYCVVTAIRSAAWTAGVFKAGVRITV